MLEKIENRGWLKKGEKPYFERLDFPVVAVKPPEIGAHNESVKNILIDELVSGKAIPESLHCCLSANQDDVLISNVERYGIPLRTVLNMKTGLMRSDPYYSKEWLNEFYSKYYRDLYSNGVVIPKSTLFADQIRLGQKILDRTGQYLKPGSQILDIGCGLGGALVPFKLEGHQVSGIDLGTEYVGLGNKFDLNLKNAEIDEFVKLNLKFDLIIVSHVLEHILEIFSFLEKIKALLAQGGKLYAIVPGIHMIPPYYADDILLYLQNAHCWHFTMNTFTAVLHKAGLKVEYIDETIDCIASIGDSPEIDLSKEGDYLLNMLHGFENRFEKRKADTTKDKLKRKAVSLAKAILRLI